MLNPKKGTGIVTGANVKIGATVAIWNYVVIGDNTIIGDGTIIGSFCDLGKNVVLGKNCNIQAHVTISNGCVLGDNVFIAPNSSLLNDKYPKSTFMTPPIIKNGARIGGGVTILPDVTIGENCSYRWRKRRNKKRASSNGFSWLPCKNSNDFRRLRGKTGSVHCRKK